MQTPPRPYTCSTAPELPISFEATPAAHLGAPELLRQTPTRPYTRSTPPDLLRQKGNACSAPPDLHTSTPPHLYDCGASPDLHGSTPLRLHVCTPAAHLPSSRSLEANTSTSLRQQRASRAPRLLR